MICRVCKRPMREDMALRTKHQRRWKHVRDAAQIREACFVLPSKAARALPSAMDGGATGPSAPEIFRSTLLDGGVAEKAELFSVFVGGACRSKRRGNPHSRRACQQASRHPLHDIIAIAMGRERGWRARFRIYPKNKEKRKQKENQWGSFALNLQRTWSR